MMIQGSFFVLNKSLDRRDRIKFALPNIHGHDFKAFVLVLLVDGEHPGYFEFTGTAPRRGELHQNVLAAKYLPIELLVGKRSAVKVELRSHFALERSCEAHHGGFLFVFGKRTFLRIDVSNHLLEGFIGDIGKLVRMD